MGRGCGGEEGGEGSGAKGNGKGGGVGVTMIEGSTVVEVAGWGHEVGWGDGGRDLGVGTTVAVGGDEMEMVEVAMVEVAMAEVKVVAVWVEAKEEAVHTAAEVKPGAAMAVATEGVVMKEVHQVMVERVVAEMAVVKEEEVMVVKIVVVMAVVAKA